MVALLKRLLNQRVYFVVLMIYLADNRESDTIEDVSNYIERNANMMKLTFLTNFPRQEFDTEEKLKTTLADAGMNFRFNFVGLKLLTQFVGLVPRGQLIATKRS